MASFEDITGRADRKEDAPTIAYPTHRKQRNSVGMHLPHVKLRFGEQNVKVIPAQDGFRRPIEDYAHIYVRGDKLRPQA